MAGPISRDDYLKDFVKGGKDMRRKALSYALDIRKFEIELYWKRATYFWAFIATAFGAYIALVIRDPVGNAILSFVACCFGFVLSLAWYFVNRGSKAWQVNWELHVDLLETDIAGPLYKTVLASEDYRFWNLNGAYKFSPSKISQLLSLFVTVVWAMLAGRTITLIPQTTIFMLTVVVCTSITVLCAHCLYVYGQSEFSERHAAVHRTERSVG